MIWKSGFVLLGIRIIVLLRPGPKTVYCLCWGNGNWIQMTFKKILSVAVIVGILVISCKNKKEESSIADQQNTSQLKGPINILKYKVKEENFSEDMPGLRFKTISLEKRDESEYYLDIEVAQSSVDEDDHKSYYVILAIYPFDDEIQLLENERQKYGFETFSVKIKKNDLGKFAINRTIKTRINFARAITVSVLDYETKQKRSEVVMQKRKILENSRKNEFIKRQIAIDYGRHRIPGKGTYCSHFKQLSRD